MNRSIIAAALLLFCAAVPLKAQQVTDPADRLRTLEQRLDALQRENDSLRAEIEALRRELAPEAAPAAAAEDLTAIDVTPAAAAPVAAAAAAAPPPEVPVDLMNNAPSPGASKIFNPDIAVIGNFLGKAGDPNPFEERSSLAMEESEISFQAFVDPYAQAKFFVAVSEEGASLEEGFVQFVALPHDFTARAGRLKAAFGKENLMHTHVRPWVDQPLVVRNFFGEEGLSDSGVSVSRIFPNDAGVFVEATAEAYRGNVDGVFEGENLNDLAWLGHLKLYRDLSEQSNLEVGASYMRGTLPGTGGANQFYGADVTFRYKPLQRAIYRSLISRTEVMSNRRPEGGDALGFYTSLDWQFARRWFAGVRFDRAGRPGAEDVTDRGGSLVLTFWPSEFSQLRAQARRVRYGSDDWVNELLMQVQFSIGAHGAHSF